MVVDEFLLNVGNLRIKLIIFGFLALVRLLFFAIVQSTPFLRYGSVVCKLETGYWQNCV